jgi:hypothetical protein
MSDDNIDLNKMEQTFIEAKEYEQASLKVIVDLQRKLKDAQTENEHLKLMLSKNVPMLDMDTTDLTLGISNEQLICETQISNLKMAAMVRDLTLEETRKFQTFVDVLEKIKKKNDNVDITIRKMSDDELLKLVSNESKEN